jgi:gentisate 1,2-dioxygenase
VLSLAGVNPERARFSREIGMLSMKPVWERTMRQIAGAPAVPAIWRWQDVRPHLMHATELITAREAERRVLMLENPALPGTSFVTPSLFAGLQIILPGEIAASHRHTPSALRFVIEGGGAYTSVGGERITMRPGDLVVTPGWTWHDHGNSGSEPVIWLDGLDTAFANLLGAHFREDGPGEAQALSRPEGDVAGRFEAGLAAVDYPPQGRASPMLSYSYERTRDALSRLSCGGPPHPSHGYKLQYINPVTASHPFPTMAVYVQLLPSGFKGRRYRATDGTVFCVVEGHGRLSCGDARFDFAARDIFVVPSWQRYELEAGVECVLFSYSDRAAQEALGFWRAGDE